MVFMGYMCGFGGHKRFWNKGSTCIVQSIVLSPLTLKMLDWGVVSTGDGAYLQLLCISCLEWAISFFPLVDKLLEEKLVNKDAPVYSSKMTLGYLQRTASTIDWQPTSMCPNLLQL